MTIKKACTLCCNYVEGDCLLLDDTCPQAVSESIYCKYFRKAILPLHPELEQTNGLKQCSCGNYFVPKCNRQRYCSNCSNQVTWNRNYRKNKGVTLLV